MRGDIALHSAYTDILVSWHNIDASMRDGRALKFIRAYESTLSRYKTVGTCISVIVSPRHEWY